jgi:hypothetical protein
VQRGGQRDREIGLRRHRCRQLAPRSM